jgi:hypothetical protein
MGHPNSPYAVNSVGDLRAILASTQLKVLVAHGLLIPSPPFRVRHGNFPDPAYGGDAPGCAVVYPGGHMFYSRERFTKPFATKYRSTWSDS